jgi:hypothetical protein
MAKNKNESLYDPCPLVDKMDSKQKGLFKLNGMEFVLIHFPELKSTCCSTCSYFKEILPKSYTCRRFYFTTEQFEDAE